MKYIYFLLVFFFSFHSGSQVLVGTVLDSEDNPLMGVTVINNSSKQGVVSDREGKFIINTFSGDYVRLSFIGKKTKVIQIPTTKSDTIYQVFILEEKINTLNEYSITGKRIEKIAGIKNEYILDYMPMPDGKLVVLSKLNQDYFIALEQIDTIYNKNKIEFDNPSKLEMDCYGNVHLLCKEKVYQLWVTDTIIPLYEYSYKQFNESLKPLLFCNENQLITEKFSNHNKLYQIHHIDNSKKTTSLVYKTYDKNAEKIAAGWYNQIIAHYYKEVGPEFNLIENGVWDGNVVSLQVTGDLESTQFVSWYLKVSAKEMNIQSFSSNRVVYLFDLHLDSISILSINGELISKVSSDIAEINSSTKIIHDKQTDKFYYFSDTKLITRIYEINPITGKSKKIITLKEVRSIKNLKINESWLYFVKKKSNGYQKLYRVKLKD